MEWNLFKGLFIVLSFRRSASCKRGVWIAKEISVWWGLERLASLMHDVKCPFLTRLKGSNHPRYFEFVTWRRCRELTCDRPWQTWEHGARDRSISNQELLTVKKKVFNWVKKEICVFVHDREEACVSSVSVLLHAAVFLWSACFLVSES